MSGCTTDIFSSLITQSSAMHSLLRAAHIVAATDVAVLVYGETGTGKELLARALHQGSPRADCPFVAINCAALPEHLAESELFGHRRGAFTDARSNHPGYIRQACGGSLFLDEIGELSLGTQARLLRFLELGECQGVGESNPVHVNVRVIAATNRDLAQEVEAGRFRRDLFYRLNIVPLQLPPLRERRGDVARLASHFIQRCAERLQTEAPKIDKHAMRLLKEHAWPGNVRELKNLCERLCILLPGHGISVNNLPLEIRSPEPRAQTGLTLPADGIHLIELEADLIRQALGRARGNKSHAARLLGLSRDTLLYRLKKHAIAD